MPFFLSPLFLDHLTVVFCFLFNFIHLHFFFSGEILSYIHHPTVGFSASVVGGKGDPLLAICSKSDE